MQGRIKLWNCGINLLSNDNIGYYSAEILHYPFFQAVSLLRSLNDGIYICFLLVEKQKVLCTDSPIKRTFNWTIFDIVRIQFLVFFKRVGGIFYLSENLCI